MSHIQKKISLQEIILRVYRTIKPSDSNWIGGAIQDAGLAIQAIGYHTGFEQKSTPDDKPIVVKKHRGCLPPDCERVLFVEQYTKDFPSLNLLDAEGKNIDISKLPKERRETVRLPLGKDITLASLSDNTSQTTIVKPATNYYDITSNHIITAEEECLVKIHYIGFPIDNEGMPLIIDDYNYKEAVFWYIVTQMLISGYVVPSLNWKDANALFERHRDIAANNVKMPSIDGMERLVNTMTRIADFRSQYQNFGINFEQPNYIGI